MRQAKKTLQIKSSYFIYLISIIAALSSFIAGYTHVFLSQLAKTIQNKNHLTA